MNPNEAIFGCTKSAQLIAHAITDQVETSLSFAFSSQLLFNISSISCENHGQLEAELRISENINRQPSFMLNHSDLGVSNLRATLMHFLDWCQNVGDQIRVHRNWDDDDCSIEEDWADDSWLKVGKPKRKRNMWPDVATKARNNHWRYSSQAYGFVGNLGTPFNPVVSTHGVVASFQEKAECLLSGIQTWQLENPL